MPQANLYIDGLVLILRIRICTIDLYIGKPYLIYASWEDLLNSYYWYIESNRLIRFAPLVPPYSFVECPRDVLEMYYCLPKYAEYPDELDELVWSADGLAARPLMNWSWFVTTYSCVDTRNIYVTCHPVWCICCGCCCICCVCVCLMCVCGHYTHLNAIYIHSNIGSSFYNRKTLHRFLDSVLEHKTYVVRCRTLYTVVQV